MQEPESSMHGRFGLSFFGSCCLPIVLLAISLLAIGDQVRAQEASVSGNDGKAIEHVLRMQQEAWNRHDLEGFMAGYWRSPELTFFSGAKEQNGWQATM